MTYGLYAKQIPVLLRSEVDALREWAEHDVAGRICFLVVVTFCGSAAYGFTIGFWRAPEQGVYAAIKFPLVILLATFGNALLNGMVAPLLGINLRFRQSLFAVLTSFAITATILGGVSPILFFLVVNTPTIAESGGRAGSVHAFVLLIQVAVIAVAGVIGNLRLMRLLRYWSGDESAARRVMFCWLGGNLFLGAQLSWNLRPFIGSPDLPIQFLRPDALQGNFYEAVWNSLIRLINT